ncbi:tRNA pseudouridine synthase A [Nitrospina gracilis 3/211]|uniref:tRNA pseudouridine synthase A n=1 Tax=Nitrospina gracilis (strain 3/211) TaxID=1266370 RepID=M1Z1W5_NITG3|nr:MULTISPECIES: tRNA pseudouridine(38-40) synthase TruA [Nitrospina]MCF8724517.1 tRNA pseudouridine38-40 synthase [Nitrospina sp. Nb-3]CCQ91683.1 tRNA pseudouridine synthase A [Nitrospina gracilis 3/211]
MRRIKLLLEYEGSQYHGWQYQPNGITIQEVLEKRLETITGKKTPVVGSGRTDSGVHAEGQVAHFNTASNMTPRQFLKALNSLLPHDIVVRAVEEVDSDFHARKSAKRKIYRYTLLNRDYPSALRCRQAHYVAQPLKVTAMRKAARHLVGKHNFKSFQGAGCEAKSAVREIHDLSIKKRGDWIEFSVDGSGFLKHMVRNLVGTLIEVGYGRIEPDDIKAILKARDRKKAGPTAPARGLCLVEVFYDKPKAKRCKVSKKK